MVDMANKTPSDFYQDLASRVRKKKKKKERKKERKKKKKKKKKN